MNRFVIPTGEESSHKGTLVRLDLDRCLFSGQVFRWRKLCDGVYEGVDGNDWFFLRKTGKELSVESSASEAEFRRFCRLDADVDKVAEELRRVAPEMAPTISSLAGLRLMRPSDPVEVFYCFLCTANNNLKRIMPMVQRLCEYGEPLGSQPPGGSQRRFPRSEIVAAIPEDELRAKGFGYRGATIPYAAGEVMRRGGDDWIAGLKAAGYEEAHRKLVGIKGIGHKLADCICLYGLHYDEAVPIDTHLWQAACRVFFPKHAGKSLTESRYREVGDYFRERFGDLAGWAHLFLYYGNMTDAG